MTNFLADVDRDRIGVADEEGERGFVTREAYDAQAADSWDDGFPVVDSSGKQTGLWYGGIGFIELDEVEPGAPFSLEAMHEANGIKLGPANR